MKSKILSIFIPGLRTIVANASSDSHKGKFGGDSAVIYYLIKQKKMSKKLIISLLKPRCR